MGNVKTAAPAAVTLTIDDDRATLSLGRVERANALDADTVDAVIEAVDTAEEDSCRVLVIRSAANQFCAGFDLDGVPEASTPELAWRFLRIGAMLERLQTSAMLTIAVMDGPAVGAGADLAMACDARIGSAHASFKFPGSAFGVVLGTRRLAAVVGDATAVRLVSTGERVTAEDSHRLGLLDVVVPPTDIDREVERIARTASHRLPSTLRALKAAASPRDPAGLADLARSLMTQPDLATAITRFARQARPTTPREDQA